MPNEQKQKIWLSPPHMSGKESDFIQEAFDTNWIAPMGPHVNHFEEELAEYCGTKGAVVLSSGTAAIHLALITLDVQPAFWSFVSHLHSQLPQIQSNTWARSPFSSIQSPKHGICVQIRWNWRSKPFQRNQKPSFRSIFMGCRQT